jgi:hypothetical protein
LAVVKFGLAASSSIDFMVGNLLAQLSGERAVVASSVRWRRSRSACRRPGRTLDDQSVA